MGRSWHIAEGRLAPGERGGADVIAIARDASGPSNLSSEQRAVLSQLKHTTIPFAERDASGVTGLVAAPRWWVAFRICTGLQSPAAC